jgi:hypothetical protein
VRLHRGQAGSGLPYRISGSGGRRPAGGSPGVYRDAIKTRTWPRPRPAASDLYTRPDPGQPAILRLRQLGSPWWSYTVQFRDRLRANPAGRLAYEQMKRRARPTPMPTTPTSTTTPAPRRPSSTKSTPGMNRSRLQREGPGRSQACDLALWRCMACCPILHCPAFTLCCREYSRATVGLPLDLRVMRPDGPA